MTLVLNQSDIYLIRSGEHAKCFVRSPAQTAPPADPWSAPDRADRAWFTDRDLQALRPTQLSLRRWTWTRPQAISVLPQADPEGMATPRFWHRLIRFRHVISGLLALASLNRACRNLVPAFPQRSPPSLLTTAACGGLRSTPDCRPRRALLHLSYSYAPPCGPALLVTQGPTRKPPWPAGGSGY